MRFKFKAKRFIQGMDVSPERQHFAWMGYFTEGEKRRLFRAEAAASMAAESALRIDEADLVARIQHLDTAFFLEGNGLFQADRITMPHSLEARVPLLDLELFEFVSGLPTRLRMPWLSPKQLLRTLVARHLPRRIARKPKKGFGPPTSS